MRRNRLSLLRPTPCLSGRREGYGQSSADPTQDDRLVTRVLCMGAPEAPQPTEPQTQPSQGTEDTRTLPDLKALSQGTTGHEPEQWDQIGDQGGAHQPVLRNTHNDRLPPGRTSMV
jgi:hypothetical protein